MIILKYPLALEPMKMQEIDMPMGAKLLDAQLQNGNPVLWASCPESAPPVKRRLVLAFTGHPGVTGAYVATFQTSGGMLVWHLYDLGENNQL